MDAQLGKRLNFSRDHTSFTVTSTRSQFYHLRKRATYGYLVLDILFATYDKTGSTQKQIPTFISSDPLSKKRKK